LEQTAARLGLEPRPEFRRAEDVSIFLHAADLYVSCSHSESFGMANLEALSAGLAAICTPVGGVPDVVGDAARMVPVGNVPALAAELQELLTHSAARAALAERGRVRADAWPGRAEIAERYLRICQAAVSAAD
jgi:glycosyltransferase involved in cell wall biosynthesis